MLSEFWYLRGGGLRESVKKRKFLTRIQYKFIFKRILHSVVLDYLPELKWGPGQAFLRLQHPGKTCKIREKVGKFGTSGKRLKTQEHFLENHSTQ